MTAPHNPGPVDTDFQQMRREYTPEQPTVQMSSRPSVPSVPSEPRPGRWQRLCNRFSGPRWQRAKKWLKPVYAAMVPAVLVLSGYFLGLVIGNQLGIAKGNVAGYDQGYLDGAATAIVIEPVEWPYGGAETTPEPVVQTTSSQVTVCNTDVHPLGAILTVDEGNNRITRLLLENSTVQDDYSGMSRNIMEWDYLQLVRSNDDGTLVDINLVTDAMDPSACLAYFAEQTSPNSGGPVPVPTPGA